MLNETANLSFVDGLTILAIGSLGIVAPVPGGIGAYHFIVKSILVEHGKVKSNCFIIDKKLAYISDVSKIYSKDFKDFKNLKYLIIDCLWYNYHPSHFNLETSLSIINKFSIIFIYSNLLTHSSYLCNYVRSYHYRSGSHRDGVWHFSPEKWTFL